MIIGNPPYVDIKGLNKDDVKFYFDKYSTTENRINLYSIFIEKGLELININGVLSYINPNSMLVNSSYFKLRELILPYLKKIIKLPDNVFEDAKVETIIFELFKNNCGNEISVINYSKDEKINFIDESRTIVFLSTDWEKDSNLNFNLYASKSELNLINKIENLNVITLNQIADFTLGITPYDKYKGHSQEIIKSRAYHSAIKIDDSYKPLITGENIIRYFVSPEIKEYIKYGDWLGAKREERFFINSRILIRQIVSGNPPRIYCGYTEEELYFTQIGFGIISKNQEQFTNKYILTLLNSKLLNFYHKYKFLDLEKDLFQKVLIANCKELPIIKISLSEQLEFVEKADLMLSLNNDLKDSASKFQRTLQRKFEGLEINKKLESWYELTFTEFVKELGKKKIKLSLSEEAEWEDYFLQEQQKALALKQQIDSTDQQIDKMVYELYGLTDEEIKIVEES